ncbi:OmpA family protein [Neolewinella persica]|uniref:OmpA family protein n=1 Tax=Neolewinella persica TaxID=70998 RepID=UPI0003811B77|nr:thrombospondin type 3 repeat-containing protein [Neolewinella persica]
MKRVIFGSLLVLLSTCSLFGQDNNLNSYNALSARVLAIDHNIPNEMLDGASQTYALEFGFRRQFTKLFGIAVPIKIGVIDVGELNNISISGIEALAQFYPAGTEGKICPYLHAGYGVVSERFDDANHQIPLGLGLNFRLDKNSWFNVQGEYRISDQDLRSNVMAGVGYVYRFSSIDTDKDGIVNRNDLCPTAPGPAATNGCPDTDMDGITDAEDRCPKLPGSANLAGCPDTDMDGVPDVDDKCPEEVGPATSMGCPDTDGDGIIDADDKCPMDIGTKAMMGCPDADGDGVPDAEDKCPADPGTAAMMGCPDTDGDGVADHLDKCPDEPGTTKEGCPDADGDGVADGDDACPDQAGNFRGCPDSDGDGVADNEDRCPTQAGPAASGGCPEIKEEVKERLEYAARAVRFETGSAKLMETSYIILSEIGGIMRQYPDYNLTISGHTDDVGSDVNNLSLSEQRAEACQKFIVATGISSTRISSAGYGETRPVGENSSVEGRRLNRRVEFDLIPRQ